MKKSQLIHIIKESVLNSLKSQIWRVEYNKGDDSWNVYAYGSDEKEAIKNAKEEIGGRGYGWAAIKCNKSVEKIDLYKPFL